MSTIEGTPADDEPTFPRGPSNVLLVLTQGDSRLWPGLEVEELLYTEGDADIENDAGMLEDALSECVAGGIQKPGRYLIEGFEVSYHTDYWSETDADYAIKGWREATETDEAQFYVDGEGVTK